MLPFNRFLNQKMSTISKNIARPILSIPYYNFSNLYKSQTFQTSFKNRSNSIKKHKNYLWGNSICYNIRYKFSSSESSQNVNISEYKIKSQQLDMNLIKSEASKLKDLHGQDFLAVINYLKQPSLTFGLKDLQKIIQYRLNITLQYLRQANMMQSHCAYLIAVGKFYQLKNELDKVLYLLKQCVPHYKKTKGQISDEVAHLLNNIGLILGSIGTTKAHFQEAISYHKQSSQIRKTIGKQKLGQVYYNIGFIYQQHLSNNQQAKKYYEQGIQLMEEIKITNKTNYIFMKLRYYGIIGINNPEYQKMIDKFQQLYSLLLQWQQQKQFPTQPNLDFILKSYKNRIQEQIADRKIYLKLYQQATDRYQKCINSLSQDYATHSNQILALVYKVYSCYSKLMSSDKALQMLKRTLKGFISVNFVNIPTINKTRFLLLCCDVSKALKKFQFLYEPLKELKNTVTKEFTDKEYHDFQLQVHNTVSNSLVLLQKDQQALQMIEFNLKLLQKTQVRSKFDSKSIGTFKANNLTYKGIVLKAQGQYQQAIENLLQAQKQFLKYEDQRKAQILSYVYENLFQTYFLNQNYQQAQKYNRKSIQMLLGAHSLVIDNKIALMKNQIDFLSPHLQMIGKSVNRKIPVQILIYMHRQILKLVQSKQYKVLPMQKVVIINSYSFILYSAYMTAKELKNTKQSELYLFQVKKLIIQYTKYIEDNIVAFPALQNLKGSLQHLKSKLEGDGVKF